MENDKNDKNPYLKDNGKARKALRVVGWICAPLGVVLLVVGFISFTFFVSNGRGPALPMAMFIIGGVFMMVGFACLSFGYMKKVSSYVASQSTPAVSESANYLLHDTRDELKKTVDEVKGKEEGLVCLRCGTKNEAGTAFCDHCGAPLTKKCPSCGEDNDIDSDYCRKCGKHL